MLQEQIILSEALRVQNHQITKASCIIVYLTIFYLTTQTKLQNNHSISNNTKKLIVCIILFFNPLTYHQIINYPSKTIRHVLLIFYLYYFANPLLTYKNPINTFKISQLFIQILVIVSCGALSTLVIAVNCFLLFKQMNNIQKSQKMLLKIFIKCIVYAFFIYISCLLGNIYFPTKFEIGLNMIGLLLSHTFTKYLYITQVILALCPFLSILPLNFVPCSPQLKLTFCYFFTIYCNCQLSNDNQIILMLGLYIMEILSYKDIIKELNSKLNDQGIRPKVRQQIIVTHILLIGSWCVSMIGYYINIHFQWLYLHTHIAGVSYLLVGELVFWIAHSVFLTESLGIQQNLFGESKTKRGLKQYFREKILQI